MMFNIFKNGILKIDVSMGKNEEYIFIRKWENNPFNEISQIIS